MNQPEEDRRREGRRGRGREKREGKKREGRNEEKQKSKEVTRLLIVYMYQVLLAMDAPCIYRWKKRRI